MSAIERETKNNISKYEAVRNKIQAGYRSIEQNYSYIYGYIDSIKETEPRKAAVLELMVLDYVPKDNSIIQQMDYLRRLIKDLDEQSQEDFDERLLDTEVENYVD